MSKVKTQADLDWEIQCFGMTEDSVKHLVETQALPGEELMFAAGILSDAQQMLDPEFNDDGWVGPETANRVRQHINVAKYIIFKTRREEV